MLRALFGKYVYHTPHPEKKNQLSKEEELPPQIQ